MWIIWTQLVELNVDWLALEEYHLRKLLFDETSHPSSLKSFNEIIIPDERLNHFIHSSPFDSSKFTYPCKKKMPTSPSKTLLLVLTFIATVLIQPLIISCDDDDDDEDKYLNCYSSLNCFRYSNLGYPFWGPNRPDYCGHPSFKLTCEDEAVKIEIESTTYRVLEIDTNTQALTVARIENNTCPRYLKNSTFDSNIFYYSSNTQPLKLLYDCSSLPPKLPGRFSCNINSTYYVNLIVTQDTDSDTLNNVRCNHGVDVAISQSEMQTLKSKPSADNLIKALETGFELQWRIDNSLCYQCQNSGGQCGSKPSLGEFACYCLDGAFKTTCGSTPSGMYHRIPTLTHNPFQCFSLENIDSSSYRIGSFRS